MSWNIGVAQNGGWDIGVSQDSGEVATSTATLYYYTQLLCFLLLAGSSVELAIKFLNIVENC